ncbi:EAL domain-containing protein [Neiella marina]|uniref:EAL domain-containing protein n=1 Tax=Neiella holothuriorum TaxID=2870530 RepID=A0ABS7EFH0_9GAMM|nr:EAL domain-containing protein [Neiella holothuriorum]MBW8191097.1 EAL domain-containing protein [Neiella holothuriorum]
MLSRLLANTKISHKLLLALFFIGLVPPSSAVWLSYKVAKHALIEQANTNAETQVKQFAKQANLQLAHTEQVLSRILGIDEVHQFFAMSDDSFDTYQRLAIRAQIPQILNNFTYIPGLNDINLMREDGVLLHFGSHAKLGTVPPQIRNALLASARVRPGEASWIGGQSYSFSGSEALSESSMAVIMPFEQYNAKSLKNEVRGIILLNINAPLFFDFFSQVPVDIAIADQRMQFVFHHKTPLIGKSLEPPLQQLIAQQQSGTIEQHNERLMVEQIAINGDRWRLLLFQSEQALLASIERIFWLYLCAAVAGLAIIICAVRYFERYLVAPLTQVTEGLRQLHRENFTDTKPLQVKSRDEIGVLIQWFNRYLQEVQQRLMMEKSLRASESRYALATAASNDALFEWDFDTDEIYYSARCAKLFGIASQLANKSHWLDNISPTDRASIEQAIEQHLAGHTQVLNIEYGFVDPEGRPRRLHTRALAEFDQHSQAVRLAGSHTDITLSHQQEAQLQYDASHDYLTGLFNRQWLFQQMNELLSNKKTGACQPFAIALFDLDSFKVINDSLGHSLGDRLLQAVAERLSTELGEHAQLARLGGDEFVMLIELGNNLPERVQHIVKQLLESVAEPFNIRMNKVQTTASAGIVFSTSCDESCSQSPEDILRDADIALYQAKDAGKNCLVVFEAQMRQQLLESIELENQLAQAIANDQLTLHYQPIYELSGKRVIGCEALVRWIHPKLGFISPADFIPIAEKSSLILELGQWVYQTACQQLQRWDLDAQLPNLNMSINMSPKQFDDESFFTMVPQLLRRLSLDPARISLELTETAILEHTERNQKLLATIKQSGMRIYLDDFGTGYSSIAHLATTPIDAIKIDKTFVDKACIYERDNRLLVSILAMAKHLELDVVAEGIETPDQLNLLISNGCALGQGYLLARPMPADEFADLVRSQG